MARKRGWRNFLVLSSMDSANECCQICNCQKIIYTCVHIYQLAFSKKTGRSAYSALSSGFDYVGKYLVYGNWFTCEERKRLLVDLLQLVVISYLISGYFIMGILEKIAEIESEVYNSI